MFASSAARLPKDENEDDILGDIGTPSPPETPPVDDSVAPQPAQVPVIDDAPPSSPDLPSNDTTLPPPAGTTTPDETLDTTIADAGAGPDLGPPATKPLPDLTPPTPTTPHQLENAKLEDAAVTATQNESLVKQRGLQEEEKLRAKQAVDADKHAAAVQKVIEDHEKNLQALLQKKQEYFDAARNAPFHDLYAERSTGDRILGAVAIFLGGLGGGQNQAMQILDNRMKHAYDKQAADIEGKWKLYGEQSKNIEEAQKGKNDAIANLNLLQSARYEAAADQLVDLKVRQGIPLEQAKADKDVVEVRQKAADIRMKEAADATKAAEQKTKDDLERRLKESEIRKNDAQAGKLGRHGEGGGGGGVATAAEELSRRLRLGADDGSGGRRELTQDEKIHAANELHIPINGKPSQTTLDSISKGAAFDAKTALALAKGGASAGGDKDFNTQLKDFHTEAIGTSKSLGPVRQLSQIEAMRHGLDEAVKTGDSDKIIAAALKAKEQAGTIMSGGKMTQAQANMLHDLESTADQLQAKIGKFTGNPTAAAGAVSRLSQLIDDAGHETLAQVSDIRNRSMNAMLRPGGAADTPEKKRAFLNRTAGLFSEVKWRGQPAFEEGKNPVPTPGPVDEGTTKARSVVVPADHGEAFDKLQRAKTAAADLTKSPQARQLAKEYVDKYSAQVSALGAR